MNDSDQVKLDQSMEDSTAMTIKYLRERLLSERTVSKSARQRADELAKRVLELEEQLRIVSLQRMRAEKATADVLAILESNGISDVSETFDSSSDQDIPRESKVGNKSFREDENSVSSKLQSSDLDFSPATSRSLSWKGHKDSPGSIEKYKDPSVRRRSKIGSVGSSPKHRPGKSCRQIRRKESKSVAEGFQANPGEVDSLENGVATASDVSPNYLDNEPVISEGAAENGEGKTQLEEGQLSDSIESGQNASGNEPDYSVSGRVRDMEKALEHQAQLIGQFQEMEKAQQDWEEKFRENNSSTPDSCDPGNRSDVTEERYETKGRAPHAVEIIASETLVAKSEVVDLTIKPNSDLSPSRADAQLFEEQGHGRTLIPKSPTQDSAFSMETGNKNAEIIGNNYHHPPLDSSHRHHYSRAFHDSLRNQTEPNFPSNMDGGFNQGTASGSQNEPYALVPHKPHSELSGVLEALKQARESLEQRINRLPMVEGGGPVGRSVEPSGVTKLPGVNMDIPIGCVGLFRLPTDSSTEGNIRANFLSSSTRFSLGKYYPDLDTGLPAATRNQFTASPYLRTISSYPAEDHFLSTRISESESRIPTQNPSTPYVSAGLPHESRDAYPTYPLNPTYPETMLRTPIREGFSTFPSSRSAWIPPAENFSFSVDQIRPNRHRY